jgi:hypothetical protein
MEESMRDIHDRLALLERENHELRAKLEASAGLRPRSPTLPSRAPVGCASLFVAVGIIVTTILFPPWLEVRTERRELLYYSEHVEDLYSSFAGFDYLLSAEKWKERDKRRFDYATYGWGKYGHFEVTVYRVFWPMIVGEWLFLGVGAVGIGFALRRRGKRILEAIKSKGLPDSVDVVEGRGVGQRP